MKQLNAIKREIEDNILAEFYKILKADALGEPWAPNKPGAKAIQNYWCQVEGQEKAVSIGKQVREDGQPALHAGQHVYGNLMYAKSQKGTEYWKFKGEMVPEGVTRPTDAPATPAQATAQQATGVSMGAQMPEWFMPVANQIDYIFREMRKMDTEIQQDEVKPETYKRPEVEPVDEETQAKIDEIFGAPEPDEEK